MANIVATLIDQKLDVNGRLSCVFNDDSGQKLTLVASQTNIVPRRYTPLDGVINFSDRHLEGQSFMLTVTEGAWISAEINNYVA